MGKTTINRPFSSYVSLPQGNPTGRSIKIIKNHQLWHHFEQRPKLNRFLMVGNPCHTVPWGRKEVGLECVTEMGGRKDMLEKEAAEPKISGNWGTQTSHSRWNWNKNAGRWKPNHRTRHKVRTRHRVPNEKAGRTPQNFQHFPSSSYTEVIRRKISYFTAVSAVLTVASTIFPNDRIVTDFIITTWRFPRIWGTPSQQNAFSTKSRSSIYPLVI